MKKSLQSNTQCRSYYINVESLLNYSCAGKL